MSWWWRTKPRSIIKTVDWFKEFGKLEGEDWDFKSGTGVSKKDGKPIYLTRRKYIYAAHSEEDQNISSLSFNDYCSGKFDTNETESNGRNDKTTYEFFGFGYVKKDGTIKVNNVGKKIIDDSFDSEDFLKQFLKLQFPNPITKGNDFKNGEYIFPLELICKAFEKFDSLNRSEFVLLFGCNSLKDIDKVLNGIEKFKLEYSQLKNKSDNQKVRELCQKIYIEIYGVIDKKIETYYDYAEGLCRALIYTGLFKSSGRSLATKIRVPEYSKVKFNLLLDTYKFERKEFNSLDEYMLWYGDSSNVTLPWENSDARKSIIIEKLNYIRKMKDDVTLINKYGQKLITSIDEICSNTQKILKENHNYDVLKKEEQNLVSFITGINQQFFIDVYSKTNEARSEILEMYDQILEKIDEAAMWLEVNTWKSLIAINGNNKLVKRNFNIEEDLSPKSFAPGIGNTPDMELYSDDRILIPEVSLMSGVQQWEHEASSVIDHVLSFITEYKDKKVKGLFISQSINIRTRWNFFILNKESWMKFPVPVVPLTINQYKKVINCVYDCNLNINDFLDFIDKIHYIAIDSKDFDQWFIETETYLSDWIDKNKFKKR